MANIAIFDPSTKRILKYIKSANTAEYVNRLDVLINPAIDGIDLKFAVEDGGLIRNMSIAEKDTIISKDKLENFNRYRALEYGPIPDQLDMLYHDMQNGTSKWIDHIYTIKQKYPKPKE